MFAAVDVGLKSDAFFPDFPTVLKGVHLKTAAICEHGTVPTHEFVQAAGFIQNVRSRPQVQVVGVSQHNAGVRVLFQMMRKYALDRSHRSHRHEERSLNRTVARVKYSSAGFTSGILGSEVKSHAAKVRRAFHYFCAMFDPTHPTVFWTAFSILAGAVFFQIFFWMGVFAKVAWASKKGTEVTNRLPPLTLLADGRNAEELFPKLLERWDQLEYANRVDWVAINNQSVDETEEVLDKLRLRYPQMHQVLVPKSERFYDSKKFPITLGIKAAKTEAVLLTHAEGLPVSNQWAAHMAAPLADPNVRLVLGAVRMEGGEGWWARTVRFAHAFRQLEYLSWAKWGLVVSGDGANLAYQRSLFFELKGFLSHMHLTAGEDDLFVNEAASHTQVRVLLQPEAQITVPLPSSKDRWKRTLRDQAQARSAYRPSTLAALQLHSWAQWLFALSALGTAVLIPLIPNWWIYWLALVGGRTLLVWIQWALAGRFLALGGLVALFPVLEWVYWGQRAGLALLRTLTPAKRRW